MTNLSDLFPAGAGKQVSFTADGNISAAGKPVALTATGKVKQVSSSAESPTIPYGTDNEWSTSANKSYGNDMEFDPVTAGRVGVAYLNGSKYPCFIMGTRSGSTITWGSEVVLSSTVSNVGVSFCFDPNNADKIMYLYYDSGTGIRVNVGTISGSGVSITTSFGTAATLHATTGYIDDKAIRPQCLIFDPSKTSTPTCLALYWAQASSTLQLAVATYSSTTATAGSTLNLSSDLDLGPSGPNLDVNSAGTYGIACKNAGSSGYVGVLTAGISGTTPSVSSITNINSSDGGGGHLARFDPNNDNKFGVPYEVSSIGKVQIVTLSGSGHTATVTAGTETSFVSENIYPDASIVFNPDASNGEFIIGYQSDETATAADLVAVMGTYDDSDTNNTITMGSSYLMLDKSATDVPQSHFFNGCDGNVFGVNFVFDADDDGQLLLGSMSGSNVSDLIGISDAAISDTASGNVTIKGGIAVNGLSSLTPGTDYYAQGDGTISTTSTSPAVKIGKALSATSINLEYQS